MSDQPLDLQGYGAARDERLSHIRDMIELEAALQDGAAFRMAIDMVRRQERVAQDMLAEVNPADVGSVAAYQADIRSSRTLCNFLQQIINRGKDAEASLRHDTVMGQDDL